MSGCLNGIRVLELARFQAGPRAGMASGSGISPDSITIFSSGPIRAQISRARGESFDIGLRDAMGPAAEPSRIFLYRRPILDEWCERGDVGLSEIIAHVLIHEIGHHFGLSDDDMEAIEAKAEEESQRVQPSA